MRRTRGLEETATWSSRRPAWAAPDPVPAPERIVNGLVIAGARRRAVAYLTDVALITVLWSLGYEVLDRLVAWPPKDAEGFISDGDSLLLAGIGALTSLAWFGLGWSNGRSTPGMFVWRIRLVQAADGASVTVRDALRRWGVLELPVSAIGIGTSIASLAGYPEALTLDLFLIVWPVLLLISIARSPTRSGWHDRFAGTLMVRRSRPGTAV